MKADINPKKARIYKALKSSQYDLSPKEIHRITGIPLGTIKPYLRQMLKAGMIYQNKPGFYLSYEHKTEDTGLIRPPLQIHGLKLEYRYNPGKAPPSLTGASSVINYTSRRHKKNGSIVSDWEFLGRIITETYHPGAGLIEIFVNTRDGKDPLDLEELQALGWWLSGRYPKVLLSQWIVSNIGLNYDYSLARLEGIRSASITFRDLQGVLIQIYEKRSLDIVRVETHISRKDIEFSDILDILGEVARSVELRLISR